jgi:hypothetical protein
MILLRLEGRKVRGEFILLPNLLFASLLLDPISMATALQPIPPLLSTAVSLANGEAPSGDEGYAVASTIVAGMVDP